MESFEEARLLKRRIRKVERAIGMQRPDLKGRLVLLALFRLKDDVALTVVFTVSGEKTWTVVYFRRGELQVESEKFCSSKLRSVDILSDLQLGSARRH